MNFQLLLIKYSACALVFASAVGMIHSFPVASNAAHGGAVTVKLTNEKLPDVTKTQAAQIPSSKVTISSL